jgi:hypothetical protein
MSMATDAEADRVFAAARLLAEHAAETSDEVLYRSAVSRAYYAVFLTAASRCGTANEESVHEQVYLKCRRAMGGVVAERIKALKRLRVAADYFIVPLGTFADGVPDGSNWAEVWRYVEFWTPRLLQRIRAVHSWR